MNILRDLVKKSFPLKHTFGGNIFSFSGSKNLYPLCSNNITIRRYFASEDEEMESLDFEENVTNHSQSNNKPLRDLLYSSYDGEIFQKLRESTCIKNVFDLIEKLEFNPEETHGLQVWVQSVLVLSDLQRIYSEDYLQQLSPSNVSCPEEALVQYLQTVNTHKSFHKLTDIIMKNASSLSPEELSYCGSLLFKMGVMKNSPVISSILYVANEKLQDASQTWDIDSLVRMSEFFNCYKYLQSTMISVQLFPHILKRLDHCESIDDFQKITVALFNIFEILSYSHFLKYKEKLNEFLDKKILNNSHTTTVLKVLSFLNLPYWYRQNFAEYEKLCSLLTDSINEMSSAEIVCLYKAYQTYSEPAIVSKLITERAQYLLEVLKSEENPSSHVEMSDLYHCQMFTASVSNKRNFEPILKDMISKSFLSNIWEYYKLVRVLKNDNKKLSHDFWSRILQCLQTVPQEDFKLLRMCYKYIYFDNVSSFSYRNYSLEKFVAKEFDKYINTSSIKCVPWKFSRMVSFLVAYSPNTNNGNANINLQNLVDQLTATSHQLSLIDSLLLSKSLNIFMKHNSKRPLSPGMGHVCLKVNNIIRDCISRLLKEPIPTLFELNTLLKLFINSIAQYDTADFYETFRKYDETNYELTSKLIKDTAYCMSVCSHGTTLFFDKLCNYIENKRHLLTGDTVYSIVNLIYTSGYIPKSNSFLKYVADIVGRDKEIINGLTFLQACEALCFYDHLTSDLVKYVFSIEFMERLDEEIASCYYKRTYPDRMRKQLLILNRSVCIDFPEHDVPWFHEKYLQEQISLTALNQTNFYKDVYEKLKCVVDPDAIQCFHHSPYGYRVDFCFQLDKDGKLTSTDSLENQKVGVILLDKKCYYNFFETQHSPDGSKTFSINISKKGRTQMMIRHLELLNYIIIEIPTFYWHSLHMSETEAKVNYIKQQLSDRNIHFHSSNS